MAQLVRLVIKALLVQPVQLAIRVLEALLVQQVRPVLMAIQVIKALLVQPGRLALRVIKVLLEPMAQTARLELLELLANREPLVLLVLKVPQARMVRREQPATPVQLALKAFKVLRELMELLARPDQLALRVIKVLLVQPVQLALRVTKALPVQPVRLALRVIKALLDQQVRPDPLALRELTVRTEPMERRVLLVRKVILALMAPQVPQVLKVLLEPMVRTARPEQRVLKARKATRVQLARPVRMVWRLTPCKSLSSDGLPIPRPRSVSAIMGSPLMEPVSGCQTVAATLSLRCAPVTAPFKARLTAAITLKVSRLTEPISGW
jgi:hypothetical protein